MTQAYLIKIRSDSSYHYALSRHNQRGGPVTRFQTPKKLDPNTQEMIDTASIKPSENKLKCLRLMTIHKTRSPSHNDPFVYALFALTSDQRRRGSVCIDLEALCCKALRSSYHNSFSILIATSHDIRTGMRTRTHTNTHLINTSHVLTTSAVQVRAQALFPLMQGQPILLYVPMHAFVYCGGSD